MEVYVFKIKTLGFEVIKKGELQFNWLTTKCNEEDKIQETTLPQVKL